MVLWREPVFRGPGCCDAPRRRCRSDEAESDAEGGGKRDGPPFRTGRFDPIRQIDPAGDPEALRGLPAGSLLEKISVKLEFEGIRNDSLPETKNHVLSALPAVSYLIAAGDFRVPRPNAVMVAETIPEILSDKIRALLECRYLKGRDIFDLWYLRTALNAAADKEMIERKFRMYTWPFQAARDFDFFAEPSPEAEEKLKTVIRDDLSRFLPSDVLAVHQAEGYASFLATLQSLFTELKNAEVPLP